MDKQTPRYLTCYDKEKETYEVTHIEDGTVLAGIDSFDAAKAIAILCCLGHLYRTDDGVLSINATGCDDDVETADEFEERLSQTVDDDGPEIEDERDDLCPPPNGLEYANDA